MDFQTLQLLYKCNKQYSHVKLRLQDLTDTECMLCSYVNEHPGCSQDDVARALLADKTTVAKASAFLEKNKFLIRKSDPDDRRRNQLRVTKAGMKRVTELMNVHDEWLTNVLSCLSAEERAQFEDYCVRILNSADAFLAKEEETEDIDAE